MVKRLHKKYAVMANSKMSVKSTTNLKLQNNMTGVTFITRSTYTLEDNQ